MKKLTQFEKGWISGLIDGEGCLTLKERNDSNTYKPSITIANNSKSLMEKLKQLVPSGKVYTDTRDNQKDWETSYQFKIWKLSDIEELLKQIKNSLIIKKKKAGLLISFCESREKYVPKREEKGKFAKAGTNPREKQIYDTFNQI